MDHHCSYRRQHPGHGHGGGPAVHHIIQGKRPQCAGVVAPDTGGGLPSILARSNYTLDELRSWGSGLSEQERRAICGAEFVGTTYAGI